MDLLFSDFLRKIHLKIFFLLHFAEFSSLGIFFLIPLIFLLIVRFDFRTDEDSEAPL